MTNLTKGIIGIGASSLLVVLAAGIGGPNVPQELNTIPADTDPTPREQITSEVKDLPSVDPVIPVNYGKSNQDIQTKYGCHPNYSGCLDSNASDYDCVDGSGNGPYYTDTVQVIGPDVFGLDRDGDGWGCE